MNGKQSIAELVDLDTVNVSLDLPYEQRVMEFIKQIKDPFNFRCGKYRIKAHYRKNGAFFEDIVIGMKKVP